MISSGAFKCNLSNMPYFFKVEVVDKGSKKSSKTGGGNNVADILEQVINQRFDVMNPDSDDSEFDDDDSDDDWDD